jgi:hypothetical protein
VFNLEADAILVRSVASLGRPTTLPIGSERSRVDRNVPEEYLMMDSGMRCGCPSLMKTTCIDPFGFHRKQCHFLTE